MKNKEQLEYIQYDLFRGRKKDLSFIKRMILKHISPPKNFVYLCRKMWYYSQNNRKTLSKLYYLRILHKYGCIVFPDAKIGKGLCVFHPVGIVIGHCVAGENLTILQGVTIGEKKIHEFEQSEENCPHIGNNVTLCAHCCVLGNITICDMVVVGANAVITKSIEDKGTYTGIPARRIEERGL